VTTTTGSGTDPHPEVAEISDLSEGLLPPGRGADVREHIAGCALCTDVLGSLEEIRGLLGTLPGPQRMPADIAGRIDAALAAEALLDAMLPGSEVVDVPRGTSEPEHVPRGTSTVPTSGGPKSDKGRPSTPSSLAGPGRRIGRRGRRGLLVAASMAGVLLVVGGVYELASNRGTMASSSSADGLSTAQVGDQVRQLLAGSTAGAKTSPGADNSPMLDNHSFSAATGPTSPAALPSCVLKATQRTQTPLASEHELFQGIPAYLVVLPHPGDDSLVDAFVVNASCTASSPGAVLFQSTYSR